MRIKILIFLFMTSLLFVSLAFFHLASWFWSLGFTTLFLLAIRDVLQKRHTILRNFPLLGHFRYLLEMVRPEIQQYFIQPDVVADPISRIHRNVVYAQSKGELETVPFGSELDLSARDYRWINHSCFPVETPKTEFRVTIGNFQCQKPYSASLFNISAMSYGSLSKEAILALGRGAKVGNFSHNTGEGGLSPHHLATGADLVWQIGTAYFGTRDDSGHFDENIFRTKASLPQVKMIEIKISQGAKPGHGGVLPGVKVNAEISKIRRVPMGKTVLSPAGHSAFSTAEELCQFIAKLRALTEGKPVGFKMCLGRREEFIEVCEAMIKTQIFPDFITIDGGEGGTGAAPFDFINFVGSPLNEALFFVNSMLTEFGVRKHVKIIASGKIFTAFDIFEKLALGADLCNSARGMMLSLGCIQAYRCNTNRCPTGIATSDSKLSSGLDVTEKSQRVTSYHKRIMVALADLMAATGLQSTKHIALKHISCRQKGRILTLAEYYAETATLSEDEQRGRQRTSRGQARAPDIPEN
jgi:glutamate synthase domain-containing protein 2